MRKLYPAFLLIAVIFIVSLPFVMIATGFMVKWSWMMRTGLVAGGLLIARLVKPLSVVSGKDLTII